MDIGVKLVNTCTYNNESSKQNVLLFELGIVYRKGKMQNVEFVAEQSIPNDRNCFHNHILA